jgi:hypothetical protein
VQTVCGLLHTELALFTYPGPHLLALIENGFSISERQERHDLVDGETNVRMYAIHSTMCLSTSEVGLACQAFQRP